MIIIPAIDLLDGQIVRLKQGQYNQKTIYNTDPVDQALKFVKQGAKWLHIVDLDGARTGRMKNLKTILKIRQKIDNQMQVGGGIRDKNQIDELIKYGINRIILGTRAIEEPDFLKQMINNYGNNKIAVSLDVKDGVVMVRGWKEKICQDKSLQTLLHRFESVGLKYLIYTDINQDGMMTSLNFNALGQLQQQSDFKIIASGGVSSPADIKMLWKMRIYGCIVGRAVYEDEKILQKMINTYANKAYNSMLGRKRRTSS